MADLLRVLLPDWAPTTDISKRWETVLCRRKYMPNGHIYRGKNRLYKEPTWEDVQKLRNQFEIEEQNMFYLRHAYLTPEQSSGHAKALGKHEKSFKQILTRPRPYYENVTIESRLAHLRVKEAWE